MNSRWMRFRSFTVGFLLFAALVCSGVCAAEAGVKRVVVLIMDCSSSMVYEWPGEKGERYAESWKDFKPQFLDHVKKKGNDGFDFVVYTFGTQVRSETRPAAEYDTQALASQMLDKLEAAKRPPRQGENTDIISALTKFQKDILGADSKYKGAELYIYFYTDGAQTIWHPKMMGDFNAFTGPSAMVRRQEVMDKKAFETLLEVDKVLPAFDKPNMPANLTIRYWGKKPPIAQQPGMPEPERIHSIGIDSASTISLRFGKVESSWDKDMFSISGDISAAVDNIDSAQTALSIETHDSAAQTNVRAVPFTLVENSELARGKSADKAAIGGSFKLKIAKASLNGVHEIKISAAVKDAFVDGAKREKARLTSPPPASVLVPVGETAELVFESPEEGYFKQGLRNMVLGSTIQLPLTLRWNEAAQREFAGRRIKVEPGDARFDVLLHDVNGKPVASNAPDLAAFPGKTANFQLAVTAKPGRAGELKSEKIELLKWIGADAGTTRSIAADVSIVPPRFDVLAMSLLSVQRLNEAMAHPKNGMVEFSIPWFLVTSDPQSAGQKVSVELVRDDAARALNPEIVVDDGQTPFDDGKLTLVKSQHQVAVKFKVPQKEADRLFGAYQPGQLKAIITPASPGQLSPANGSPQGYTVPLQATFRGAPAIEVLKILDIGGNELRGMINVKKGGALIVRLNMAGNAFALGKTILLRKIDLGAVAKIEPVASADSAVDSSGNASEWNLGKLDMPRKDFELKISGGQTAGRTPQDKFQLIFTVLPDREATTEDPYVDALEEPLKVDFPAVKVYVPGVDVQMPADAVAQMARPALVETLAGEYILKPIQGSKGNPIKITLEPVDGTAASLVEVIAGAPGNTRQSYDLLEAGTRAETARPFVWTIPDDEAPLKLRLMWRVAQRYALLPGSPRPVLIFDDGERVTVQARVQPLSFEAAHEFTPERSNPAIGREPFDVVYTFAPAIDPREFGAAPLKIGVALPSELKEDLSAEILGGGTITQPVSQVTVRFNYKKGQALFESKPLPVAPVLKFEDVPLAKFSDTVIKTAPIDFRVAPILPGSTILAMGFSLVALLIVIIVLRAVLRGIKGSDGSDGGFGQSAGGGPPAFGDAPDQSMNQPPPFGG